MKFRFSARRTKSASSSKRKSPLVDLSSTRSDTSATTSTSSSTTTEESAAKYEYGDDTARRTENSTVAPTSEVDYGYGDCSPAADILPASSAISKKASTPRRSSMKGGMDAAEGNTPLPGARRARRASIGCTGEVEVNLPGKRAPVRRRTSISFCEEPAQVHEIVPVASLTDEPEALWFQSEEYSNIKKKMRSIVHAVEKGEGSSSKKTYCTRGLEGHLGQGAKSKTVSRETAWDAVLKEQYMQQHEGNFDDEGISNLYRLSSIESKIAAAQRATRDESEAEAYQQDTRRRMRRMSM
jgi:hypothetical protein